MNLLRVLTVKALSLSLILMPTAGYAQSPGGERGPLFYRVKQGDALSEVLDRLLLRPIYPVTGSLRRTIAANPGRFHDLEAQVFSGEKIYFAQSDEIMLRENNEVLASGEVRFGHRPTEVRLTSSPAKPSAPIQTETSAPQELKKAAVEAAVLQAAQPVVQRQEPELAPARDPEDLPVRVAAPSKAQTFPAKEDEGGVVKDAFLIEHSGERSPPSASTSFQSRQAARRPASETSDEPLEQDNYFPMGDSPVAAPRASDTKVYQSDF